MSSKTIVELVDDIDGNEAAESVTFAIDGVNYTIDLSDENAAELRSRLAPFVESARKVTNTRTAKTYTRRQSRPPLGRAQSQAIREWARGNGEKVSDRGRIPSELAARFQAAQTDSAELVDA
jgi:hypothetical protein